MLNAKYDVLVVVDKRDTEESYPESHGSHTQNAGASLHSRSEDANLRTENRVSLRE